MEIKLWSNPKYQFETKIGRRGNSEKFSISVNYLFTPGVTMLIGTNGSGKTTLLRQINSVFVKHSWNKIKENDNIRDKYYCYLYDNVYEEKYAKDSWLHSDNLDRVASTFGNSEGQDMRDFLYYKMVDVGKAVRYAKQNNYNGIFLLFDGLDSGLSLDKIEDIRISILDFIIKEELKQDFEVYIICSANSYEFCNNYDCIDVTDQKHVKFTNYKDFENYFIKEEE